VSGGRAYRQTAARTGRSRGWDWCHPPAGPGYRAPPGGDGSDDL